MNKDNINKTIQYLKRNGLQATAYMVCERLQMNRLEQYDYLPPSNEELEDQRARKWNLNAKVSILVPTYETNEIYLRELIDSVLGQTYSNLELILADASESDKVERVVSTYSDERIVYHHLEKNAGISENTNEALRLASGEYCGLLDHDDLLTTDALFQMMSAIEEENNKGNHLQILFSDEDKCNENACDFSEPNHKPGFNLDLILSNNYICHFLIMKTELMKSLQFRKDYDGAQDYDLILRGIHQVEENQIRHIPKVLYHWRCHRGSTAANPASKRYAYEAGKHAVEDFLKSQEWNGTVMDTIHLGYYRVTYQPDLFSVRKDVAAIGGNIYDTKNKITSGILNDKGECVLFGLQKGFSGYRNIASVCRDADALDLRNAIIRPELYDLYLSCVKDRQQPTIEESLLFAKEVKSKGYRLLWDPLFHK